MATSRIASIAATVAKSALRLLRVLEALVTLETLDIVRMLVASDWFDIVVAVLLALLGVSVRSSLLSLVFKVAGIPKPTTISPILLDFCGGRGDVGGSSMICSVIMPVGASFSVFFNCSTLKCETAGELRERLGRIVADRSRGAGRLLPVNFWATGKLNCWGVQTGS